MKYSFIPKGGAMQIFSEKVANYYLNAQMLDLSEIDVFGQVTQNTIALVDKQESSWSKVASTALDKSKYIYQFYTGYETSMILGKQEFTIGNKLSVPNDTVTIKFKNSQSVKVPALAIKFWITIQKWPFLDDRNSLRFGMRLSANLNGFVPNNITVTNGTTASSLRIEYYNGTKPFAYVEFPTFAIEQPTNTTSPYDGTYRNVDVFAQNVKEKGYDVIITLGNFNSKVNQIFYDPVLYLYQPNSSPTTAAPGDTTGDSTDKEKQPAESAAPSAAYGPAATVIALAFSSLVAALKL